MRSFTHDDLHVLIEGEARLAERSAAAHARPHAETVDEMAVGKGEMMAIYAEATGCRGLEEARKHVADVAAHMRRHPPSAERTAAIAAMAVQAARERRCHSSYGNDYVCFCDEK